MIIFEHVTKEYPTKLALEDLNLQIEDGEIFGLIGHNGAGKTTAIKALTGIHEPTSGRVLVGGYDVQVDPLKTKAMIGYVPDSPDMFLQLSAREYWDLIASIYGVSDEEKVARLKSLLETFPLERTNEALNSYSHGMRQRVFLIGALLPNPSVWVLDEPMTGLDPEASYRLKEMMRTHAKEGNTVLFSTHVLEVAETLCDRIAILQRGHLIFLGTMEELKAQHPGEGLERIYLKLIGSLDESGGGDSHDEPI